MITVVHLIGSLEIGGAEMMLCKLLSRMDKQRFRNVVFCLRDDGPLADEIRKIGIPVYGLGMQHGESSSAAGRLLRLLRGPIAIWRLVTLLRRTAPDIVQTWLPHADLLGLLGGKLARVPVTVWSMHASNVDLAQYPRHHLWARQACARLSDQPQAVVVVSEAVQAFHAEIGYRARKWVLIPNGVDTAQFVPDASARLAVRQELGLECDVPLIGLVARYDPMKDHRSFLQAANLLSQQCPEPHFVLIGRGVTCDNATLKETIEALGLNERVHLLGERTDTPRLTAALDIATSSSSFGEGFGIVIAEAMSCTVPCVVTDIGTSAQIVGNTGRIVPPVAATAMASAWHELLGIGPEERRKLGQQARARVEARYSLDSTVQHYQALYERLAITE